MRSLLLSFILLLTSIVSFGQKALLEGKITDAKTGATLSSITIKVDGENITKKADVDGNYNLNLEVGKKYSLTITGIGYKTKTVDEVVVEAGKTTALDIVLEAATKSESEVVVRSSARKESTAALIAVQKNTAVVAQVISAEAIRRSPDKNTGEILKRVPGTSVQDGKYLVVRGLADRYNQAMLNGILLSSTEPDRKTFSFDIFPASIIDNIVINKTFVPELPGEWAGGIVQVNTKDVPAKNFLTVQVGTGFNTQTMGKDFYGYAGSSTDFLGFDNGARALPSDLPRKAIFNELDRTQKTEYGKSFSNNWAAIKQNTQLNTAIQISGGFTKKLSDKSKVAAVLAFNYNRSNKNLFFNNRIFSFANNLGSLNFDYSNNKYSKDILAGALANITFQLGANTKIAFKNILNVNTSNYTTLRTGKDFDGNSVIGGVDFGDNIKATELAFKANTFFSTQLSGDHNLNALKSKLHWYGSFNILDQYIPDQRRLQYNQLNSLDLNSPYQFQGFSQSSQRTGSRYFGSLSDYIYTAGADVSKIINVKGVPQTIKAGYFFQVKDRLFDSRPFAIYLNASNTALQQQDASTIFSAQNFGNGLDNKFAFSELSDSKFRYIANSILNAGYLQFDNQILKKLRVVWGLRIEDFDQVIGSLKQSDPRHVANRKRDYLPGVNITYKLNDKTNIRVAGSQTVIRPEFRELSNFQFFDFDLGATVTGEPNLQRTQVTNVDLRYELYPNPGELFTVGLFYKKFKNPIELFLNPGAGGSSSFNYVNPQDANSYGAELEFRKKLTFSRILKNFTTHGNISYIYNKIPVFNRPMQGQSPYVLNLGLQYDVEKMGLTTTILFNQIGRRVYYVGNQTAGGTGNPDDAYPPVWEAPRALLDLQIAKKVLSKKGELKLNISDIFNRPAFFYHDVNKNGKYDAGNNELAIKRTYGSNVSISFSYNIK
jgi:TonB-dependent receptor